MGDFQPTNEVSTLIAKQDYLYRGNLVQLYMKEIARLHGVSMSIVSDRNMRLLSTFWLGLKKVLGTHLDFSNVFYPQKDGYIEHLNQILEDMLHAYALDFAISWDSKLHLMEFTYNNSGRMWAVRARIFLSHQYGRTKDQGENMCNSE